VKAFVGGAVVRRAGRRAVTLALPLLFVAPSPGEGESLNEVYRRVSTSVVVIRARGQELTAEGLIRFKEIGSGVLISPDGKVATAAHVVATMEDITVEFLGEEPVSARVISSEPLADISIIQVSVVPRDATVAKLADSDPVVVGDPVFIVGAPYGLSYSLSQGIISARWAADTVTKDFPLAEFFQTDAVINTGNSGGPMFTREGELIGIISHNITKSGGSEGLGFVVTSNTVKRLVVERRRGWFGVDLMPLTGALAQAFNLPQAGGFLVKQVVKNSIGSRIGLRAPDRIGIVEGQQIPVGGDIILSIQGIPTNSLDDRPAVLKKLEALEVGDDLRVTVFRDDKVVELST
jgi:S1-C subfamily serine protease